MHTHTCMLNHSFIQRTSLCSFIIKLFLVSAHFLCIVFITHFMYLYVYFKFSLKYSSNISTHFKTKVIHDNTSNQFSVTFYTIFLPCQQILLYYTCVFISNFKIGQLQTISAQFASIFTSETSELSQLFGSFRVPGSENTSSTPLLTTLAIHSIQNQQMCQHMYSLQRFTDGLPV